MKRNRFFRQTKRTFASSRTRLLKKRIHKKTLHRRKQFILLDMPLRQESVS